MKKLLPFYLLCAALAAAAYVLLSAHTEWTLFPYTKVLELLFGLHFTYSGTAYEAIGSAVVITRSCSGLNLFLSTYAILVIGFLHRAKNRRLLPLLYFISAVAIAFIVTLARIIVSLPFAESPHFKLIHTVISLCVFFGTGLLVYSLTQKITDKMIGGHTREKAV